MLISQLCEIVYNNQRFTLLHSNNIFMLVWSLLCLYYKSSNIFLNLILSLDYITVIVNISHLTVIVWLHAFLQSTFSVYINFIATDCKVIIVLSFDKQSIL